MTLLLAAGADATALNRIGRSPLESAAEASNVVAIQALLGAGVDMTTHPDGGYTPLDRAACCSSSEAMGFLRPWEGTQRGPSPGAPRDGLIGHRILGDPGRHRLDEGSHRVLASLLTWHAVRAAERRATVPAATGLEPSSRRVEFL